MTADHESNPERPRIHVGPLPPLANTLRISGALDSYAHMAELVSGSLASNLPQNIAALVPTPQLEQFVNVAASFDHASALTAYRAALSTTNATLARMQPIVNGISESLAPSLTKLAETANITTRSVADSFVFSNQLQKQLASVASISVPNVHLENIIAACSLASELGVQKEVASFAESDEQTRGLLERLYQEAGEGLRERAKAVAPAGVGLIVMLAHLAVLLYIAGNEDAFKTVVAVLYGLFGSRGDMKAAFQWTRSRLDSGDGG